MKKILQRIGLLAAAVLLLWGWQGMNAKADDYTGNWTVDRTGLKNCHIMLSTMIDSKMYDCFSIYPGDDSYNGKEYWFLTAPKVVYSTDDVNEIEASATYDSVQQCYYYRLPNHGTGKIVMTGEAVNLEFHSSLSEPAQLVSNDEKSYFLYDLKINSYYDFSKVNVSFNFYDGAGYRADDIFDAKIINYSEDNRTATVKISYKTENCTKVAGYKVYAKAVYDDPQGDEHRKTDIMSFNVGTVDRTISSLDMVVTPPVAGQPLPKKWQINTEGITDVTKNSILWLKEGNENEAAIGNAEPNTTYYAILTLVAERGYKFNHDSIWIVTNPQVEYTSIDLAEGRYLTLKYTFTTGEITNTTDNTDTSASDSGTDDSQEDPYKIIEGTKGTWNGSTTEGLTIRGDGDFAKFAGVRVDGNWIPSAHYEAKSGSTIVTLKPSYLASLSEGEHTVDIMWIDDSASTTFTVAANTAAAQPELDSVPKTGEGVMGWMPEILLLAAAGLVTFGGILRRRSKIHL